MTATKEIDTTSFKLLWWDLADLTESKVNSWMEREFRCERKDGQVRPLQPHVKYVCKDGVVLKVTPAMLAHGTITHKAADGSIQLININDTQFQAFLEENIVCNHCGQTKQAKDKEGRWIIENWKVKHLVKALKLYHAASSWRNMWFTYNMNGLVFYDQRSVRVVPVDHAGDVETLLKNAKKDLVENLLPLDTLGVFGKWGKPDADIDFLWDESIKFPKFYASDQNARQAVLDTVKNSILGFVREANEKLLAQVEAKGKIHKRTATALTKRLEELKRRDVWNVHMEPAVKAEMEALEGLLEAEEEEEE